MRYRRFSLRRLLRKLLTVEIQPRTDLEIELGIQVEDLTESLGKERERGEKINTELELLKIEAGILHQIIERNRLRVEKEIRAATPPVADDD